MSRAPSYYTRPDRLHSHEDMMRMLKERTTRKVPIDAAPLAAEVLDGQSPRYTQATPSVGGGVSAQVCMAEPSASPRPAPLQWLPAVKSAETGCYTIKDTLGAYTVAAERTSGGKGWQYLAFKGSAVLAPACASDSASGTSP